MKRVSTLLRGFFLLVCCLAVASLASAQNGQWGGWCYKDFSSNGTFTVPSNCTQLYIEAVGAGGGGGNAGKPTTSLETRTGTGGGGGAYARKHVTNPSGSYAITIGVGGGAAAAGGATTVTGTGCNITAGGGQPGSSNIEGVGVTGNGGNGGTATGGDYNYTGGRGGKVCDNRITTAGSAHDRVGSGAGGGAAGGNGNGGYQDQPVTSGSGLSINRPDAIGTTGAGGGGTVHGLSNNYSSVSTWYKGGNGGQGLYGTSGWGNGSTGGYPGGGGSGARTHGGLIFTGASYDGGSGANGFVRVWFYIEKAEPLTVNIENQSTTCPYTLNATTSNYLFTNTLKWSNNSTASSITVSPSGSTTYSATVTDAYNGASHTCQITSTKSITVDGCADCGVTIASSTASPTSVCEGGTATLTASVESPDNDATYQWSVNGTNAGTGTSLSYTVTPSGTTTYTVSVTVTKGSCSASDSRSVEVTVNTKVDPTFDASLLKDNYCLGSVPAAADLPTTSTNGITGTWAATTSGTTATFTFTPSTGECANIYEKTVGLVNDPTPGTIEPDIVVCDGTETYQFNNDESAAGGVNGVYAWQGSLDQINWMTIPDANVDHYVPMTDINALAALLDVSATGTFYFRRVWTNDCGDVYSNVLSLDNPGALDPGSISLGEGSDPAGEYCANDNVSATLTANPTATLTDASFSYQWQSSTDGTTWTNISNATASSYTVSITATQNISYRYQVQYSTCDWLTSNNTYDITVNPLPTFEITANTVTVCVGQAINLSASAEAEGCTFAYSWSGPNSFSSTVQNPTVSSSATAAMAGTYTVSVTATNSTTGCTASDTKNVNVTVNALPTVLINGENPLAVEKCKNQDITLTASGASTYKWSGIGSTANPATFSATGTYTVTGTDANGCEATAEVTISENTLAVSITETLVKCYTQADGYVTYTISGGHPQFEAVLVKDNVDGTSMTVGTGENQFDGSIAAGTYKIKVTEVGETQCTVYSDPVDVAFPTVTFTAPAAETFTLPYGVGEMNVTLEGTPTFTPTDGAFTYDNNLSELNPMGVGPHTVTWTLYDACGEVITSKPQTVTINLPDCETAVELDGYNYPVVRVGYDCWFKENVKATTGIADVVAYDNDEASNKDKFGMLYTWHAAVANLNTAPESGSEEEPGSGPSSMMPMPIPPVDATERTQGICPEGWAIPTKEDFERLFINAGGDIAYLKDMDPTTWTTGKCGTAPSTGFNARGAGYYLSSIHDFNDLLSNTRFWTDKANAGETKATCCEFNYYCSEPMFKEVSAFDKLSVRCIKINTDELPTPPPTSDCPSIGTPTIEFIDENINDYNYDYSKLTLKISTPIIDFDDDIVGNATYYAYYDDDLNDGVDFKKDHVIASTGFNNPDYAEAYFTEDGVFVAEIHGQNCYYGEPCNNFLSILNQLGRVDINVKVAINCAADGVKWLLNVPFKPETTNCPAYDMTPIPESVSEDYVDVKAYINEFTSGSVDVNNISWTVTSDEGVTKTYTPANNSGNAVDGFDISVGIQISAEYGNYQWISLSGDQIAADFGEPASLTFTPSMGTTCDGESVTVTGFSATYPYMPATIDDDCPTVEHNMFEITLEDGSYIGEIPFEFEGTGSVSVSGSYYITPYTTSAPTKYDMTGDMYNVTNDNTVQVHISANATGLPSELGEGETLHVNVTIEYDECGVLVVGTYPSFDCPTPVVNGFELSVVNDNYYAEISYTGGSGNENVNGFYYTTGGGLHLISYRIILRLTGPIIRLLFPSRLM